MAIGFVKRVNSKTGHGKRGPWTLWSLLVEHEDGTESGWISAGFDKPNFVEGSYISYDTQKTERGVDLVKGSVKHLDPPARPAPVAAAPTTSSAPPTQAPSTYVSTQDSIVYQSSRKDAIALVGLLLEHDALPMSANTAKAGIAKRFDEVTAFVDKLTVQYVRDVQTGRILQSVVDAGADTSPTSGEAPPDGSQADND